MIIISRLASLDGHHLISCSTVRPRQHTDPSVLNFYAVDVDGRPISSGFLDVGAESYRLDLQGRTAVHLPPGTYRFDLRDIRERPVYTINQVTIAE